MTRPMKIDRLIDGVALTITIALVLGVALWAMSGLTAVAMG